VLNGVAESRCPQCNVDFEWQAVLPFDDLRCLRCDYQVLGLTSRRCPECGESFEWDAVLNAARTRRSDLFEHRWRTRPVLALLKTLWLATARPRKLWSLHELQLMPKLIPLLFLVVIQWFIFKWGWDVIGVGADWLMNHLAARMERNVRFTYNFRSHFVFSLGTQHPRVFCDLVQFMLCWQVATFLSLQLFVISNHRYRVRWQQILRVFVHATIFASLCPALWCVLEMLLDATLFVWPDSIRTLRGYIGDPYLWLGRFVFCMGLLATWAHIWIGYRDFLKVPRGWGISALCLVLGYLVTGLVMIYVK
jgi:endogenous inhibitor of DNA gyrase (YacG/DUF329 family)